MPLSGPMDSMGSRSRLCSMAMVDSLLSSSSGSFHAFMSFMILKQMIHDGLDDTSDRDELFKECVLCLEGGSLLSKKDSVAIKVALQNAFSNADTKLCDR